MTPATAAAYTIIAISLVLIGALLTGGVLTVEQRAAAVSAVVSILAAMAYLGRRKRRD